MSELTKEWLQQTIAELEEERDAVPGAVNEDAAKALAAMKLALASLEADVVAWTDEQELRDVEKYGCGYLFTANPVTPNADPHRVIKLYAAPPAPVSVPDFDTLRLLFEASERESDHGFNLHKYGIGYADEATQARWEAWVACRAAMLQGAEPVTTAYKLPMQPLVIDDHGTLRFKENPIVRALLDYATEHGYGLNEIALEEFDAEDQMQLAQLIGYSLSGYGTLSYVTDESYERAAAAAPQQEVK
ncbi:hypothetical protein [Enterobacter hormaechei]|uniref:hypothetical protein n=1 Tax=Enterobacter hormaechei TaxID=158836 RepID=UPI000735CE86|nr:hypothetical protein [Enterobacter hormaechei]KTH26841.1 hypothetical protein ASV30_19215 [Enterobacter hormaechei subsp. xiangfangensis]WJJ26951.1 hypothetical protein N6139_16815 [Enterobacter hormaechei]WJJ31515.1 hypothetical protein N6136_15425 [Enterobacter hormaechei]HCK7131196.1 hypothetical protein [Enterobacter hormaechei]HDV8245801.1 hypothetical protein [Enterobacter hormaechei]